MTEPDQNAGAVVYKRLTSWKMSDELKAILEFSMGSVIFATREASCELCGKVTTDWWLFDGATGLCKCHQCYEQGRW